MRQSARLFALRQRWIPSYAPDAVKFDVCPRAYQVLHRHINTGLALSDKPVITARRYAMLARYNATAARVGQSATNRCSIETAERIELVLGTT